MSRFSSNILPITNPKPRWVPEWRAAESIQPRAGLPHTVCLSWSWQSLQAHRCGLLMRRYINSDGSRRRHYPLDFLTAERWSAFYGSDLASTDRPKFLNQTFHFGLWQLTDAGLSSEPVFDVSHGIARRLARSAFFQIFWHAQRAWSPSTDADNLLARRDESSWQRIVACRAITNTVAYIIRPAFCVLFEMIALDEQLLSLVSIS